MSHRTYRVRTHSGFFRALFVAAAVFRGSPSLFGVIAGACIAIWFLRSGAACVLLPMQICISQAFAWVMKTYAVQLLFLAGVVSVFSTLHPSFLNLEKITSFDSPVSSAHSLTHFSVPPKAIRTFLDWFLSCSF